MQTISVLQETMQRGKKTSTVLFVKSMLLAKELKGYYVKCVSSGHTENVCTCQPKSTMHGPTLLMMNLGFVLSVNLYDQIKSSGVRVKEKQTSRLK